MKQEAIKSGAMPYGAKDSGGLAENHDVHLPNDLGKIGA
jgi:hypothetical protein